MEQQSRRSRTKFDRAVDALSQKGRRRVLVALADRNPETGTGSQAASVPVDALLGGDLDSTNMEIRLHHVHLPKLADTGYIAWDREAGTIETGPNWDEIAPVVRLLREHVEELPDGWL